MTIKCPKCGADNPDETSFCGRCGAKLDMDAGPTQTMETSKQKLTTGSTFAGRYQIIEELGKGGMGKVYKAYDTKIREKIALKLLKPEIARDKETVERFSNELRFARKIRHKNVCQMFDLGEEKGSHFITMEYVPGEDLKSFIRRAAPLSTARTLSIAKQVCGGLSEAHKLGVVHRDLKPNNIMIDKEGNARIMDFGIARLLKEKGITDKGIMIGTPEYMSPEQVEARQVDQRSDIYSLGVILYEMVTGRVPFEGETPFSIGMKHKGEIPKNPKELNPQMPEDLSQVILKCLEKDPEKRLQSAGELRSELSRIENGIPTAKREMPQKTPPTSREITVQFTPRKILIPALIVMSAAVIAAVIWQLLPKKEPPPTPKIEDSIAVISFQNQTGDKAYDYLQEAIPNLLITNIENMGHFYVATWERMQDILEQMGKKDVKTIDRDLGFELCQREGIETIVLGSFIKAENIFATDVKVLDVETKKLLKSASSKGKGVDSILETQIDELCMEISETKSMDPEETEPIKTNIASVTTHSMEAYKYFIRGIENEDKFYFEEARRCLEKAVELDPTFAMAYFHLSYAYYWLGNTKAYMEAIEKAKTYSDKATHKERMWIKAFYALVKEDDRENAFRTLQQITEKYPKEKEAYYWLGVFYRAEGNYDKAVEEHKKTLNLDPNFGQAHNDLGYIYLDMGNFKKSLEHLKIYQSLNPEDANPFDSLGEVYFRMGRFEEAIAKYKEALEIKPGFGCELHIAYIFALQENHLKAMEWLERYISASHFQRSPRWGYYFKGFYHFLLGNLELALINLQEFEDQSKAAGDFTGRAWANFLKTFIYYERGDLELSQKYNGGWLNDLIKHYTMKNDVFHKFNYNFNLGLIEVAKGQFDSAKTRISQMKSLLSDLNPSDKEMGDYRYSMLQAELYLAEGSFEKAISAFKNTPPVTPPGLQFIDSLVNYNLPFLKDGLARAYEQKGDLDSAVSEYEKMFEFGPEKKERFLPHPKYHYRLAMLYEQKGWKGKAIEHYQKFLSLWKNADSGLAEIEEARKRLNKLNQDSP